MATVTVPGVGGTTITLTFDNPAYATLAGHLLTGHPSVVVDVPGGYDITEGQDDTIFLPNGDAVSGPTPNARLAQDSVGSSAFAVVDTNDDTGQVVTSQASSILFTATGGGGTFFGDGADTISITAGNWDVLTSSDPSLVTTGSGDDTVGLGAADTVLAGSGSTTVFDNFGSEVIGGSGLLTYIANAGGGTVIGGSGTLIAYGGAGTTNYDLGSGTSIIVGGSGTSDISGGSAPGVFFGADGGTTTYTGSADNNFFIAGSGAETLDGGTATGANDFYAGSGNDSLVGGSGNDYFSFGSGDATVTGGAGGNLFDFNAEATASADVITDFSTFDSIMLEGGMTYTESTSGGDLMLSLSDGTTVTLMGITSLDPSQISG